MSIVSGAYDNGQFTGVVMNCIGSSACPAKPIWACTKIHTDSSDIYSKLCITVVLLQLPHMSPYIRFCSCQLNSAAFLQKKTETDNKFNEAHAVCSSSWFLLMFLPFYDEKITKTNYADSLPTCYVIDSFLCISSITGGVNWLYSECAISYSQLIPTFPFKGGKTTHMQL